MKKYIKIIFFALFMFVLVSCQKSDEALLNEVLKSINISSDVTGNLDLKAKYEIDGKEVNANWETTASSVLTKEGVITVTATDQKVTLLLTLSINESELKHQFDLTVKGSDDFLLLYALVNNQIKFESNELSSDLNLPSEYVIDGKTVSAIWISSNLDVLDNNGRLYQIQKEVTVSLELLLKLNYAERKEVYEFTVLRDPSYLPVNYYHKSDVWTNTIVNEAKDPIAAQCFAGAVYRKVVSSVDDWLGIEGVVTLPEFIPDEQRVDVSKATYYLDNASVYMGGHAANESDIGLTWSIGHVDGFSSNVSKQGLAFRPFWRYITSMETGSRANIYKNANVSDHQFYYYPGDKIRMSVYSPEPNYMQMRIELLELTTIEKYVNQRAKYNLPDDFERVFSTPLFPSEGMGKIKSEFKRVNAIDQVANEAKPTINTNSKVNNAIWHEVYLYRKINGELYKVPMTEARSASMTCPLGRNSNGDFSNTFKIAYEGVNKNLGGEVVTLDPNNGTGKKYNVLALIPKGKEEDIL